MRKPRIMLLLILLTLNLTSCYDAVEIDELLHVLVIGIDQGVSDKWRLTLKLLTVFEEKDSKEASSDESQDTITVEAPSFFAGLDLLNTFRSRKLTLAHANIIVFSEELAKSGLVEEYIAPLNRSNEIRRSAHLLVVKGKAYEFLNEVKPLLGSSVAEDLRLLVNESKNTALFPVVTLEQFYTALMSSYYQPIATLAAVNDLKSFQEEGEPWGDAFKGDSAYIAGELPRTGKNQIELLGTALFNGEIMVGELTGAQTRYLLMARGEFKRGYFTIQDPKRPELIIPLDVRATTKPSITVNLQEDKPLIHLQVSLDIDLLAVQSEIKYELPELKILLEKTFQEEVKKGIEDVIEFCQSLHTDVFMFGDYSTKEFLTITELEEYDWNNKFHSANIVVDVETIIRRTGRKIRF